mgnify:CR=1 FL=1|jgi:flagellar hook-associated protein 2
MASITSLGAGSGIFSADLVDQLVNAERKPVEVRLDQRQQAAQSKISAFGALRSALEALKSPMEALSSPEGLRAFTANSSNEAVTGVSIDEAQVNRGSYSLNVTQLAQAQSLASVEFADRDTTRIGTGTLTLNVGGVASDVVIDDSNNTLEGMASAINEANAGVSAGIVDTGAGYRLVLSSDETGTENAVQVTVSNDGDGSNTDMNGLSQFAFDGTTSNLTETVQAKDAMLEVNGIAITRSSNTVEGVVDGVTFDLKSLGTSSVTVGRDPDAVAERVQEFVDKFNALQDVIKRQSGFNAETGKGGVLSGDSTIRGIQSDLRGLLTTIPEGLENSSVRMLADVGITTDPSSGKLEFDQARFKEQLEADPAAVSALFAEKDGVDGIATRTLDRLDRFLDSKGVLSSRTDGLNETLSRIETQREQLELRIQSYRERLVSQFSAADSLIAQLNSTGDYISQQLAAIAPKPSQN